MQLHDLCDCNYMQFLSECIVDIRFKMNKMINGCSLFTRSSSAVADKPACRAASRLMEKIVANRT